MSVAVGQWRASPLPGHDERFTGTKGVPARCIGAAIAKRLASDGADVAISYVSSPAGAQSTVAAVQALGRRADALQADSADTSAVASAVDKAAAGCF